MRLRRLERDWSSVHVLFADETNTEPTREAEFFIYGGVLLSADQIPDVHKGIRDIRRDLGLAHAHKEPLEFSGRPKRITADQHLDAKRAVLELLGEVDARFIAYCVHHDVARGVSVGRRNEYALNTVLWGFHRFLVREKDYGLVVLDQLRPQERYVVSRLNADGLEMYDGDVVPMPRLTGIATAHVEWSHCLSACDVLLGAFRYCVNKPNTAASREMFPAVAPLLWCWVDSSGRRFVREYGVFLRPKEVKVPRIKARYDALVESLNRLAGD